MPCGGDVLRDRACLRAGFQPRRQTPALPSFVQPSSFPSFQCPVLSIRVRILTSLLVWRRGKALKMRIRKKSLFSCYCQGSQETESSCWIRVTWPWCFFIKSPIKAGPWGNFRFWNLSIVDSIKCPLVSYCPPGSPLLFSFKVKQKAGIIHIYG